ncbi:MAG: YifB family Mg chelatase-like AAA ATPase [Treponema sp.]|nr:YifB family Mg chelatase-like AAA ATPase [Treponema sp.]
MSVMAYAPYGAGGVIIRVEADIRRGIPGIDITGLADGAVREARERVQAAFRNSGFKFPMDRILINLAPAGMRKEGAALDLPIALAVMAAAGLAPVPPTLLVMGELELSGRIRPVRGVLAAIAAGLGEGIGEFIVPAGNVAEAAILPAMRFSAAATLREAVDALFARERDGALPTRPPQPAAPETGGGEAGCGEDFADVRGQPIYKRALEIAAAGGHNMMVFGPPGAGKTMLARRMPSIMAPLSPDEAVEVTRLYSLAGPSRAGVDGSQNSPHGDPHGGFIDRLITHPPFRTPHHSASAEGILGGGRIPRPGEISLAHFGVLFLDEAPEFRSKVLQALREPLEDRVISISRAEGTIRLPAEFQLLLATNACPCGRLGKRVWDQAGENAGRVASRVDCLCSSEEIYRYWRKFCGALLDRIELRVAVASPKTSEISGPAVDAQGNGEESSARIALRVRSAVEVQRRRYKDTRIRRNALIPAGRVETICPMTAKAQDALNKAIAMLGLSGRAYHGIMRVARTIADLDGIDTIDTVHILEAVQHRRYGEDPYEILRVGR